MQLVLPEKKMRLLVETVMMVLQPACMLTLLTLLYCEDLGLAGKFAWQTVLASKLECK